MARNFLTCICSALILLTVETKSAQPERPFPEYDIVYHCLSAKLLAATRSVNACEDREQSIALLMRRTWNEINQDDAQVEGCLAINAYDNEYPSYLLLLECIMRVTNTSE